MTILTLQGHKQALVLCRRIDVRVNACQFTLGRSDQPHASIGSKTNRHARCGAFDKSENGNPTLPGTGDSKIARRFSRLRLKAGMLVEGESNSRSVNDYG